VEEVAHTEDIPDCTAWQSQHTEVPKAQAGGELYFTDTEQDQSEFGKRVAGTMRIAHILN
jgi:hypothetical protein